MAQRREIAACLRRLYGARLVADYRSRLTLDEATARAGLTDVVRIYRLLGVDYAD